MFICIKISLILTAVFVIIFLNLLNENSDYCILPDSFRKLDRNKDGIISNEEIVHAYNILRKAGKLPSLLNTNANSNSNANANSNANSNANGNNIATIASNNRNIMLLNMQLNNNSNNSNQNSNENSNENSNDNTIKNESEIKKLYTSYSIN